MYRTAQLIYDTLTMNCTHQSNSEVENKPISCLNSQLRMGNMTVQTSVMRSNNIPQRFCSVDISSWTIIAYRTILNIPINRPITILFHTTVRLKCPIFHRKCRG
jgi:hypothetical protein